MRGKRSIKLWVEHEFVAAIASASCVQPTRDAYLRAHPMSVSPRDAFSPCILPCYSLAAHSKVPHRMWS